MSSTRGNPYSRPSGSPRLFSDRLYRSPASLLAALTVAVFASNALAAWLWRDSASARFLTHLIHHLIDSLVLVALLFPALVLLVFRPVRLNLDLARRAEKALATERDKLKNILDAMPMGICIVSRSHRIEFTNAVLEQAFGAPQGCSCHDYFQRCPQGCPSCPGHEVFAGRSVIWETMVEASGRVFEIFDTPLKNADGSTSRLSVVRDITARKVAEFELRASRQQLRSLSVHQQRTREEERKAISREIHDELGQVLATVQLGVSSLAEECPDHRRLTDRIAGMEQMVAGAIRAVQKIATQLRPTILDELGLAEAIEWQASEFRNSTGIDLTTDVLLHDSQFNCNVATAVFRIFQEALTNVIRHAAATRVSATFEQRNGRIVVTVADNGRGITPGRLLRNDSCGITGMRERAYALGGRVRIFRPRQQGTVVVAHIPVATPGGAP